MTTVPPQNLTIFKQHSKYGSYGGCEDGYEFYSRGEIRLGSDLGFMAEGDDQSRSTSSSTDDDPDLEIVVNKEEEGSRNDDERWLRLGLGGSVCEDDDDRIDEIDKPNRRSSGELVELDLLPISTSPPHHQQHVNNNTNSNINNSNNDNNSVPALLLQQQRTTISNCSSYRTSLHQHQQQQQQQLSWGYMMSSGSGNPIPWNASSLLSSPWNNNNNLCYSLQLPFQFQYSASAGPSSDMRVIDAPSSRQISSGVWFVLQASSNQAREPFLPQIPKSYLRIKDGRMTVGLVMKYLVNKLKLGSESEIELTCRGLQLLPFFTLLHVRDSIWSASRDALTLLSDSSTTDHLMILCYGRSAG